jgi:lipopolysaccharide export system permease protein
MAEMNLVSTLDRYIARHVLIAMALTLLVLVGLGFIGLFMTHVGDVGRANFGYTTLFGYILLSLPAQVYEIFPAAALVGTSAGLSMLALSSELTAIRAAGVSIGRIIGSVMKLCALLVVTVLMLGEWVVPAGLEAAEKLRAEALNQPVLTRIGSIWLKTSKQYVHIGGAMPDGSLRNIDVYESPVISGKEFLHLSADRAVFQGDHWLLSGVNKTTVASTGAASSTGDSETWRPGFGPELVETLRVPLKTMSTPDLYRYVHHLKQNAQDPAVYELSLWSRMTTPLSTLIMVLMAVPFVFGSVRGGGLGRRVFIGVLLGFAFSLLQTGTGYYALSFGVQPLVAATTPSILFLGLTIALFYRMRFH